MGWSGGPGSVVVAAFGMLAVPACSLFADLDGATGGAGADAFPGGGDATTIDVANGDGMSAIGPDASGDTTIAIDPDGGDGGLPAGVLAKDDFDTSCAAWTPYNATTELVTDAYAGTGACRVCLTMSGVGGGISRTFTNVGPGTYFVSGRVKNVNSDDWRITVVRTLAGADDDHYASGPFDDATTWQLAATSTPGENLHVVRYWFGNTYQPGDCAIVDEVTVRVEK